MDSEALAGLLEIDQAELKATLEAQPPDVKEAFLAELSELELSLNENPLQTYFPHPKQKLFHAATERRRAFFAGSRTGKSTAGIADDLIQLLPPGWVPKHLMAYKRHGHDGPIKARIITPNLTHTMEVATDKVRRFCPPAALLGGKWEKAFDKQRRILRFDRGDSLDFMSTEQDPSAFGGVDLHQVHFDEEPSGPNSWRCLLYTSPSPRDS